MRANYGVSSSWTLSVIAACWLLPSVVHGYAGEAGTVAQGGNAVSTHHTHLTRALAYCAGMPGMLEVANPVNPLVDPAVAQLAEQIALNDELTDQGTITGVDANGNTVTWTNVNSTSWSYQLPSAQAVGCGLAPQMVYPITQQAPPGPVPAQALWNPSSGFFTNRFGPWAGFFHFPQDDSLADDLLVLRAFAFGTSTALSARSLYGFGAQGSNTWSGSCYDQRLETVATGQMTPGSVQAFATYLHALGDSYSHRMCRLHWAHRQTPPWYYHTPPAELQETCAFNDHAFEFGCPETRRRAGFLEGTVQGGIAVFDELLGYALAKGYVPRVASVDAHGGWLRRQIERYAMLFRNNLNADAGGCRVSFTYALMKACSAIDPSQNGCLPDVNVADGGTCNPNGQTQACPNGTEQFPMTPSCQALTGAVGQPGF